MLGYNEAAMGLSSVLRKTADAEWRRMHAHPFVRGIGDGTLPRDRFMHYLRQDYLFLIEYSRVLALASAKAPDVDGMTRFSELLHATLTVEMDLHRRTCASFGIGARSLERTPVAAATSAYGRYLVSIAYEGTVKDIAAAILPCQWGYNEIGVALAKSDDASPRNPYASWIKSYAAAEFTALTTWLRRYLDTQARDAPAMERRRLAEIFSTSTQYELHFWDMAWNKEG